MLLKNRRNFKTGPVLFQAISFALDITVLGNLISTDVYEPRTSNGTWVDCSIHWLFFFLAKG